MLGELNLTPQPYEAEGHTALQFNVADGERLNVEPGESFFSIAWTTALPLAALLQRSERLLPEDANADLTLGVANGFEEMSEPVSSALRHILRVPEEEPDSGVLTSLIEALPGSEERVRTHEKLPPPGRMGFIGEVFDPDYLQILIQTTATPAIGASVGSLVPELLVCHQRNPRPAAHHRRVSCSVKDRMSFMGIKSDVTCAVQCTLCPGESATHQVHLENRGPLSARIRIDATSRDAQLSTHRLFDLVPVLGVPRAALGCSVPATAQARCSLERDEHWPRRAIRADRIIGPESHRTRQLRTSEDVAAAREADPLNAQRLLIAAAGRPLSPRLGGGVKPSGFDAALPFLVGAVVVLLGAVAAHFVSKKVEALYHHFAKEAGIHDESKLPYSFRPEPIAQVSGWIIDVGQILSALLAPLVGIVLLLEHGGPVELVALYLAALLLSTGAFLIFLSTDASFYGTPSPTRQRAHRRDLRSLRMSPGSRGIYDRS